MHIILIAFCAFFCVVPFYVAHAQEETSVETESTITAESVPVVSDAYLETVYNTEGIPGGGAVVGDFVVGPGKLDIRINPGESKTVFLNVTNRTGEKRKFSLTFEDAAGSRDVAQSIVLLGDDRGPYSIKDYFSVESHTFILDHNTRAQIPVTISLPYDAEPGGLYGSVLVETLAIEAQPGDTAGRVPQSAVVARIGTLFFVTIPGETEHDASLVDFGAISDQKFFTRTPIPFGILIENRGTVHTAPYGELRITNMIGEEVGYVELDPWFVLPNALRLREITWEKEFLMGRYTATVLINRSYQDESGEDIIDEMSFTFWVLPMKPLATGFAVLFILIFLIRAFVKNFEFKRKQ